ncbi:hypothetical protein CF326_g8005 [Tilletia indica]|nr:hypothetical protein CF326_g8005 [Tilletia indica]
MDPPHVFDPCNSPLLEVIFHSATVRRLQQSYNRPQICTLINIKEGAIPKIAHTACNPVLVRARLAKESGNAKFCMGAAWRDAGGRMRGFDRILEMVKDIRGMGMEVCTTLAMLTSEQAVQLKNAGLTAYNHNVDTNCEYYDKIVTSRADDDRISTTGTGLSGVTDILPGTGLPGVTEIVPSGLPGVTDILPTTGLPGLTSLLPTATLPAVTDVIPTGTLPTSSGFLSVDVGLNSIIGATVAIGDITKPLTVPVSAPITGSVTLSGSLTGTSAMTTLPIVFITTTVPALSTSLPAVTSALDTRILGSGISGTSGLGVSASPPIAAISVPLGSITNILPSSVLPSMSIPAGILPTSVFLVLPISCPAPVSLASSTSSPLVFPRSRSPAAFSPLQIFPTVPFSSKPTISTKHRHNSLRYPGLVPPLVSWPQPPIPPSSLFHSYLP